MEVNFDTRTGTLPNGAPMGGTHPELIQRDPVTGAVQDVTVAIQNIARIITEGLDYEALYQLDTSIFGRGNFGTFTFTFNGNYLARARQNLFAGEPRLNVDGQYLGPSAARSQKTAGMRVRFMTSADSISGRPSTSLVRCTTSCS